MNDTPWQRRLHLTAKIVGAYVGSSPVPAREVTSLIGDVADAIQKLENGHIAETETAPVPIVSVAKSVRSDSITCLVCGARLKTLKRHLEVAHGFSPQDYRSQFNLPASYPLTAPGYAQFRSAIAKRIGLGGNTSGE